MYIKKPRERRGYSPRWTAEQEKINNNNNNKYGMYRTDRQCTRTYNVTWSRVHSTTVTAEQQ
jgi:hypothetical protein